jgi:hypothetical protein
MIWEGWFIMELLYHFFILSIFLMEKYNIGIDNNLTINI